MDIILNCAEKFPWENRLIAQLIKRTLDDKLEPTWQVVVGESYSFEVTFQSGEFINVFYGSLGILAWKCGTALQNNDAEV